MLNARGVNITLGGRPIVRGADLHASAGSVTTIIGPNGSGKTTLLRALSGELPFTGDITLNGADIRVLKPWQAAEMRAVLPQSTTLMFPFTVREVVAMGATAGYTGLPEGRLRSLPETALDRVDLTGFGARFYGDLSGGEQQRLQLARVLCQVWLPVSGGMPRWLFLDEPVSSLDIKHQLAIMGIARDFADAGGGVLAVLHDLNLAAMFSDQILVMLGGRVAAAGRPEDTLLDAVIDDVFDVALRVGAVPLNTPFVLPQSWLHAVPLNQSPRTR